MHLTEGVSVQEILVFQAVRIKPETFVRASGVAVDEIWLIEIGFEPC